MIEVRPFSHGLFAVLPSFQIKYTLHTSIFLNVGLEVFHKVPTDRPHPYVRELDTVSKF